MIEMGLLWYEPGVPLEDRVDTAAERYVAKFGVAPNVALANPNEMKMLDRIEVRADKRCGFGHLLIGVDPEVVTRPWRPLRRASDDTEVVVFAGDGTPLGALKPSKVKRIAKPGTIKSLPSKTSSMKPTPISASREPEPEPVEVAHVIIASSQPARGTPDRRTVPALPTVTAVGPSLKSTRKQSASASKPSATVHGMATPSVAPHGVATPSVATQGVATSSVATSSVAPHGVATSRAATPSVATPSVATPSVATPRAATKLVASPASKLDTPLDAIPATNPSFDHHAGPASNAYVDRHTTSASDPNVDRNASPATNRYLDHDAGPATNPFNALNASRSSEVVASVAPVRSKSPRTKATSSAAVAPPVSTPVAVAASVVPGGTVVAPAVKVRASVLPADTVVAPAGAAVASVVPAGAVVAPVAALGSTPTRRKTLGVVPSQATAAVPPVEGPARKRASARR